MNNYHSILVPVYLGITRDNGEDIQIQISHQLTKYDDQRYGTTGIFHLYLDDFGQNRYEFENSSLAEIEELPDDKNPDFIGRILYDNDNHWVYDGEFLAIQKQEEVADFINNYAAGDVSYEHSPILQV